MNCKPIPTRVNGLAFTPGMAVLILRPPSSFAGRLVPVPGVIVRVGEHLATVQTDAGERRAPPFQIHPAGYCLCCEEVAHRDDAGRPTCPSCGGDAAAEVPAHLLPEWERDMDEFKARFLRVMLQTGCTMREAIRTVKEQRAAAWYAMLDVTALVEDWQPVSCRAYQQREVLYRHAEQGDVTGFLRAAEELRRIIQDDHEEQVDRACQWLASSEPDDDLPPRPPAPALKLVRGADDCEPDGADEMTRWLDRQFKRAA